MFHILFIVEEKYVVITIKATALPLISHKHRISVCIFFFYFSADNLPVFLNLFFRT